MADKKDAKKAVKKTELLQNQDNKIKFVPPGKARPWPKPGERNTKAPKGGRR